MGVLRVYFILRFCLLSLIKMLHPGFFFILFFFIITLKHFFFNHSAIIFHSTSSSHFLSRLFPSLLTDIKWYTITFAYVSRVLWVLVISLSLKLLANSRLSYYQNNIGKKNVEAWVEKNSCWFASIPMNVGAFFYTRYFLF